MHGHVASAYRRLRHCGGLAFNAWQGTSIDGNFQEFECHTQYRCRNHVPIPDFPCSTGFLRLQNLGGTELRRHNPTQGTLLRPPLEIRTSSSAIACFL